MYPTQEMTTEQQLRYLKVANEDAIHLMNHGRFQDALFVLKRAKENLEEGKTPNVINYLHWLVGDWLSDNVPFCPDDAPSLLAELAPDIVSEMEKE